MSNVHGQFHSRKSRGASLVCLEIVIGLSVFSVKLWRRLSQSSIAAHRDCFQGLRLNRRRAIDEYRLIQTPFGVWQLWCALIVVASTFSSQNSARAYDLHFDYTSFETGFQQSQ